MNKQKLSDFDSDIYSSIRDEERRQEECIELIPSENFVSKAVLEALGSVLTNKYSEGYPKRRYYGGNEYVDDIEQIAIDRAKKIFGADHANVQPYSGSPANMEVYFATLEFGDKILGMNLAHGGHLTHGHPINYSGKSYNFVEYGVEKDTGRIDYDKVREIALREKPKMIIAGASAYPREIDFRIFSDIAKECGAILMADISHIAGLIAVGEHPQAFPYADIVTTTTHKTLRGPRGAMIMCKEKYAKAIDKAVFPGLQGGPHNHANAAKAVAFKEVMQPEFKEYAKQIKLNAKAMADELTALGFDLVSGGTDNHLILIDLTNRNVTGKAAEAALDRAHITCNKNMIPYDTKSPFDPSGIRLGTPAVTTRGMKEPEMVKIARFIDRVIRNIDDEDELAKIKAEIIKFTSAFPLYKD